MGTFSYKMAGMGRNCPDVDMIQTEQICKEACVEMGVGYKKKVNSKWRPGGCMARKSRCYFNSAFVSPLTKFRNRQGICSAGGGSSIDCGRKLMCNGGCSCSIEVASGSSCPTAPLLAALDTCDVCTSNTCGEIDAMATEIGTFLGATINKLECLIAVP